MTTYIALFNLTDAGIKAAKDSPRRLDAAKKLLADMGGEMKQFYRRCHVWTSPADQGALSRRLGTCDLLGGSVARRMKKIDYDGYRFPPAIIQQAIWLYFRFTLSFRDVEDLLAERGITVSYESVRRWVNHFGPMIAADLRRRRPKPYS